MKIERYKNFLDAIISNINYCNFIDIEESIKKSLEDTNYSLLESIYCGFALTLFKDKYLKTNNNVMNCKLVPELVKELIKNIAEDNGKGYTIGELRYSNEYTVLDKIRHKLAHGDFIVKDDNIIITEKNATAEINIDNLAYLIFCFEHRAERSTLNDPYTKVLNVQVAKDIPERIKKEKDMDSIFNNIFRVEIKDQPIFPITRTRSYLGELDKIYDEISKIKTKEDLNAIIDIYNNNERLKKLGIHIEFSMTKITELSYYDQIKQKYFINNNYYKGLNKELQKNIIKNMSYVIGKGRYQNFDIQKGTQLNICILKVLKMHPDYTICDVIEYYPDIKNLFLYHYNDIIISSYLISFNSIYQYGLEKGLNKTNDNFISIFEGSSLDFSKLELDKLYDSNMCIEHTFENYKIDIKQHLNKQLEKIDKVININEQKLEQYLTNCKNQNEEKIEKLKMKTKESEQIKNEFNKKMQEVLKFMEDFDIEGYTKNINIIIHIRNAIAHGNVFIDSYNSDIYDTEIIFKDYLDGNVVYEKKIKVKDFFTIFSVQNVNLINNHFEDNIAKLKQLKKQ